MRFFSLLVLLNGADSSVSTTSVISTSSQSAEVTTTSATGVPYSFFPCYPKYSSHSGTECPVDHYGENCTFCSPPSYDEFYYCDPIDGSQKCCPEFYGTPPKCTYCPRSGWHYDCDPKTGRKICQPNWYGFHCDVYCNNETDSIASCGEDGKPTCQSGWVGNRCEVRDYYAGFLALCGFTILFFLIVAVLLGCKFAKYRRTRMSSHGNLVNLIPAARSAVINDNKDVGRVNSGYYDVNNRGAFSPSGAYIDVGKYDLYPSDLQDLTTANLSGTPDRSRQISEQGGDYQEPDTAGQSNEAFIDVDLGATYDDVAVPVHDPSLRRGAKAYYSLPPKDYPGRRVRSSLKH